MLLRSQTQGEELKERNVEVFPKKVEAYEAFVELSLKLLDDHALCDDEARQLRRSVYKLSLFSSEDTVRNFPTRALMPSQLPCSNWLSNTGSLQSRCGPMVGAVSR